MTTLRRLLLTLVLAPVPVSVAAEEPVLREAFTPPPAKEGYRYPDCFCTDSEGERVEVGQYACLTIGPKRMTAVCGMSLNNPAWRMRGEGCPSA